jgi:hypothetical protein
VSAAVYRHLARARAIFPAAPTRARVDDPVPVDLADRALAALAVARLEALPNSGTPAAALHEGLVVADVAGIDDDYRVAAIAGRYGRAKVRATLALDNHQPTTGADGRLAWDDAAVQAVLVAVGLVPPVTIRAPRQETRRG